MFLENNYVKKHTLVHDLNPLIKFIILLSVIFLLFLKISFFTQICLLFFVGFVIWKSDCSHLLKKSLRLYVFLFCFLFAVNFVFLKTPGFWTKNAIKGYKDFLGFFKNTGSTSDDVEHGWFYGGKILKGNSQNTILVEARSCIEGLIGWTTKCTQNGDHSSHSSSNVVQSNAWKIIPLDTGSGIKYVAFLPTWYTISEMQFFNAISLSNKIILIIILSSIFSITSSQPSFTYALEDLFRPLKLLKLPAEVMSLATAISIRFAPSLISETFRIIKAQASRGIDYKNGKLNEKASSLLSLFVPLFAISFLKSGELAEAMRARGYDHQQPRSSYRIHLVYLWELVIFATFMFCITALYYMFFNGYYLGFLSKWEYLVLIAQ